MKSLLAKVASASQSPPVSVGSEQLPISQFGARLLNALPLFHSRYE